MPIGYYRRIVITFAPRHCKIKGDEGIPSPIQ
jgi:hypothetical protein